jgi:hypothetical protein
MTPLPVFTGFLSAARNEGGLNHRLFVLRTRVRDCLAARLRLDFYRRGDGQNYEQHAGGINCDHGNASNLRSRPNSSINLEGRESATSIMDS